MDHTQREQIETIPAQVRPMNDLSDDVCIDSTRVSAEADDGLNLIDAIAVEAVSSQQCLENSHELRLSESTSELSEVNWAATVPGNWIGPYLVSAHIGGGEWGEVFLATRAQDSTQQFAVKIIKNKRNSRLGLKRFQTETRLLSALAKNSGIAAFQDAGITELGHLYLVSEYVDGLPIDAYCDHRKLTVAARLKLFTQVCEVVQFVHKHAIIHRDLRPSNILVTADGIAKLTDIELGPLLQAESGGDDLGAVTRTTLSGIAELVLSPEYASPEQVRGDVITTASDLYALGLVLYQLLSGQCPYQLQSQDAAGIFQAICEQVPEKPSITVGRKPARFTPTRTRGPLDTKCEEIRLGAVELGATVDQIAGLRGVTPRQLKHTLAGDLDAIVLMALRKEPEWRYGSSEQLGDDLHRHLNGLPLLARHDPFMARTIKSIKRHAAFVLVGLTLLLTLVSAMIVTIIRIETIRRDRDHTEFSLHQTRETIDKLFDHVNKNNLLGQTGFRHLHKMLLTDTLPVYEEFLKGHGRDPSLGTQAAMAHARVAEIRRLTGSAGTVIPHYEQAITLWERLVAEQPDDISYQVELAQTLSNLGIALSVMDGQLNEALHASQRAYKLVERLRAIHPDSVPLQTDLAAILLNIAEIQGRQGKSSEAISSLESLLTLDLQKVPKDVDSIQLRISISKAHSALGRLFEAQPEQWLEAVAAYGHAIELHELLVREYPDLGDQAYELASDLRELGSLQQKLGQFDLALENIQEAVRIFERIVQLYPTISIYQNALGMMYNNLSELEYARNEKEQPIAPAQKGRTIFEHLFVTNPKDLSYRRNLARSCQDLGRALARAGDSVNALRAFQRSIDLVESLSQLDPRDSYNLACSTARCISLIGGKNETVNTLQKLRKSDQLRRDLYGIRAIEALRRSTAGGFVNAETLQNDSDLDPLRTRTDFQALIKEVEEKVPTSGR